jgi:DNA-binding PadR family transcriptional regulator
VLSEVLGNTATKIIFRVSGEDAVTLSKTLDITSARMLSSDLTNLPDGSAIVKLRAKFGEESVAPFEIFTLQPLERKTIDFDSVLTRMQERFSAPSLAQSPPAVRIQAQTQISDEEFDESVVEFLETVDKIGQKGLGALSNTFGMNPAGLNLWLQEFEKRGLIKVSKVVTSTVGRPRTVVKLAAKGREAIGKFLGRKGSLLHRRLGEETARHYESLGYGVEIPVQGGRKEQPDLIARGFGETIAVEVETSAEHTEQIRRNYEKNAGKYDRVVFVVPNEEVGWRIKKILGDVEVYVA